MQIRDKILQRYGTLEAFAEAIDLYESSIGQYLSSKNLGSTTFKIRTTQAFGQDFHKLYLTEQEQIRHFTSTVSWYIEEYNRLKDIHILGGGVGVRVSEGLADNVERLKKLAIEKELLEDYAIVCRCFAYYYRNQGKRDRSLAYMELAVNYMRGKENIDRFGLYLSDLIWMKIPDVSKTSLAKLLEEFHVTVKQVKGPLTTGHMYYNLGQVYLTLGELEKCRENYLRVFDYLQDPETLARLHLSIGEVEARLGDDEAALACCRRAEAMLDGGHEAMRLVYRGYAQYYLGKGEPGTAEPYADRLFENPGWRVSSTEHDFITPYAAVKVALGKSGQLVSLVGSLLAEIDLGYLYTINHLGLLDEALERHEYPPEVLTQIKRVVMSHLKNHRLDDDSRNMLKRLLGSLSVKLER